MNFLKSYTKFVTNNPFIVIILCILVAIYSLSLASQIGTKNLGMDEMLPSDIEVMRTFDTLNDEFGSSSGLNVVIEIDLEKNSHINDLREPEILEYSYILAKEISNLDQVISSDSLGTHLKEINDYHMPNSIDEVNRLSENNMIAARYITDDYSLSVIRVILEDGYDAKVILKEVNEIIENTPKPAGIKTSISGDEIASTTVLDDLSEDTNKTSMISMIGIVVVLLIIFRSVFYGLSPLATIGFGMIWAFGYVGLTGLDMSSATSGVASMIMGIGIDFGIQTISRFKQELDKMSNPVLAMQTTMQAVFMPMFTTTVAGVIGFQAMTMGRLTVLADMGVMMTYGIIACFIAAITVVPAAVVAYEIYYPKNLFGRKKKIYKKKNNM